MNTHTGTVKWFNERRGFGFVAPDGGEPDLFAHHQDIESSGPKVLKENQRVSFEIVNSPKGGKATKIRSI